ncbi:MAG: DUF3347 domain-containing protein [Ferruginibacter sp.]
MKSKIHEHKSSINITAGKKILLIVAFFTIITINYSFAQDSTKTNPLSAILTSYYGIKDALISSDATATAAKAGDLVKAIDGIDMNALPDADRQAFIVVQVKLKKDAQAIAASNKIEAQRTTFSTLSDNIYSLAKTAKLSTGPVYQQYCPMKKMYWLSSEIAIKNPYYGKMMLTCGKVTDTLK